MQLNNISNTLLDILRGKINDRLAISLSDLKYVAGITDGLIIITELIDEYEEKYYCISLGLKDMSDEIKNLKECEFKYLKECYSRIDYCMQRWSHRPGALLHSDDKDDKYWQALKDAKDIVEKKLEKGFSEFKPNT